MMQKMIEDVEPSVEYVTLLVSDRPEKNNVLVAAEMYQKLGFIYVSQFHPLGDDKQNMILHAVVDKRPQQDLSLRNSRQ